MGTRILEHVFDKYSFDLEKEEVDFVQNLITGNSRGRPEYAKAEFLFDIVNNKRNSVDVDKFDYINRDTFYVGMQASVSTEKLLESARVMENQICYSIDCHDEIFNLFANRHFMFENVYYNSGVQAYELMLLDVFKTSQPVFRYENYITDTEKYLELTDDSILSLEYSQIEDLKETRDLLSRIHQRDSYVLVEELKLKEISS